MTKFYRTSDQRRKHTLLALLFFLTPTSSPEILAATFNLDNSSGVFSYDVVAAAPGGGLPAPFSPAGNLLIEHPYRFLASGVYTNLATSDAFDPLSGTSGASLSKSTNLGWSSLVTDSMLTSLGFSTPTNAIVGLSLTGFSVDTGSPTDYVYNSTNNTESRIYRGGTVSLYEDINGNDDWQLRFLATGATMNVSFDWDAIIASSGNEITIDINPVNGISNGNSFVFSASSETNYLPTSIGSGSNGTDWILDNTSNTTVSMEASALTAPSAPLTFSFGVALLFIGFRWGEK